MGGQHTLLLVSNHVSLEEWYSSLIAKEKYINTFKKQDKRKEKGRIDKVN